MAAARVGGGLALRRQGQGAGRLPPQFLRRRHGNQDNHSQSNQQQDAH